MCTFDNKAFTIIGFRRVIAVDYKLDPSSYSHADLTLKLLICLFWVLELKQEGLVSEE